MESVAQVRRIIVQILLKFFLLICLLDFLKMWFFILFEFLVKNFFGFVVSPVINHSATWRNTLSYLSCQHWPEPKQTCHSWTHRTFIYFFRIHHWLKTIICLVCIIFYYLVINGYIGHPDKDDNIFEVTF